MFNSAAIPHVPFPRTIQFLCLQNGGQNAMKTFRSFEHKLLLGQKKLINATLVFIHRHKLFVENDGG